MGTIGMSTAVSKEPLFKKEFEAEVAKKNAAAQDHQIPRLHMDQAGAPMLNKDSTRDSI